MSKAHWTEQNWFSSRFIVLIILVLFFSIALYIRIHFPYDQIFSGDWIKFASNDAYYHMRLIDSLLHNFPNRLLLDPFMNYPSASWADIPPFFHWLLAGVTWLIGLGSPSEHTIDVVAVYFPTVLGALTVIPVYFIGKELFGRWAGVISAALIAILPGEFLGRSILGFTDHHVAEVLFTTTAMMFLILAIKASREKQLTINHLRHRDWATLSRATIYSLLAGIFLGIYFITWIGALFFVFIVSAYFIIQFVIDHLKRRSTDYLLIVGFIFFLIPLIIYAPLWHIWSAIDFASHLIMANALPLISLGIVLLMLMTLSAISRQMINRGIRPTYYPLALIGLGAVGLIIFYAVSPSLLKTLLSQLSIFNPTGPITILEMQPFLFPQGNFTLFLAWANFSTGSFLSLISLGILIALAIKRGNAEKSLLLIWSLIILAATLGQRRFAYYLAVNVALLTGYFSILVFFVLQFIIAYLRKEPARKLSWNILESPTLDTLADTTPAYPPPIIIKPKKARQKRNYRQGFRITTRHITMVLGVIIIFFLVFFSNIKLVPNASQAHFAPSDAWVSSLYWLRENTPDPYGDPDAYYQLHPLPEETYTYPESAYAVTAWGDYGNWILRIAHRLPNRPPGPGGERIAIFFTSPDEESAQEMAYFLGPAYIILDNDTATDKFWALAQWSGQQVTDFYETYFVRQENELKSVNLFYPEYYRSMAVRLYNFDGKAITPKQSTVISYEERAVQNGEPIRLITSAQTFTNYEEATAYISSQNSTDLKIVSMNPFISPVPLEALEHYKLIHSSEEVALKAGIMTPEVKIFEYIE